MRSSCEASATNRRSFRSEAARALKAASIWPSIAFSARPRRPTSVRGSRALDARERSPAAIAAAVVADRVERAQAEADDPEAVSGQRGEHGAGDEQLDHEQAAQRRVDVGERGRDDEGRRTVGARGSARGSGLAVLGWRGEHAGAIRWLGAGRRGRTAATSVSPSSGDLPRAYDLAVDERSWTKSPASTRRRRCRRAGRRGRRGTGRVERSRPRGRRSASDSSVRSTRNERSEAYVATSADRRARSR